MTETLRKWTEVLETFVLEVIFEQRRGKRAALVRSALFVLSIGFHMGVKVRRFLYQVRILRDSTLGIQVIAIGNLTVRRHGQDARGGKIRPRTAKAGPDGRHPFARLPLPAAAAGAVASQQLLLRADSTPPRVVSDGKSLLLDSETAGDEPYMLASNLKDVVVLVDKNRVKSGRYAIENFGCDTLLLDDGFQYWKLARPAAGRGADRLPAALWQRAPAAARHVARAAFPSGARQHHLHHQERRQHRGNLRQRIARYNPTAGIIECVHHPLYFEDVFTGERKGLDFMAGKRVASLSGIAQPESFEQSLIQLRAELVYSKRFADHHRFTQQEILNVINRAKKRQAESIVTTQKDAVRFPKIDRRDLSIYFMRVEIKILSGADDFDDCVRKICLH